MTKTLGVLMLCAFGCAAHDTHSPQVGEQTQPIVYGKDDRVELYESPSSLLQSLGRSAIVALIPNSRVQRTSTGEVRLSSPSLGEAYELCSDQRFTSQPVAADCTGVLIDRDLVLSAGHCFEEADCASYTYVFDYFYRAKDQLEELGSSDLYHCRRLVAREMQVLRSGARLDYAVVQLDRPVLDRTPVTVRTTPLTQGEPLAVIGTGSGLPLKVDDAVTVIDPRASVADYFALEADTFEGSSGSGLFDKAGELVGVLVRGGTDYVEDPVVGCYRVQQRAMAVTGDLPMGELGHEEATYVQRALKGVCDARFPSAALCAIQPSCGDGFCSSDETRTSCAQDCDICTNDGGVCGAEIDLPSEPSSEVKQSPSSWKSREGDCSVGGRGGPWGWLSVAVVGLGLALRRRSPNRRFR